MLGEDLILMCIHTYMYMHNIPCTHNTGINFAGFLNVPHIIVSEELLGLYNFTIILEMCMPTQNASYEALYNISLFVAPDPIADNIVSADGCYVQLTLLYNTRYNVSAKATLCTELSDPTITELFYGKFCARCSLN